GGWCDSNINAVDITGNTVIISGTTTITGKDRALEGGHKNYTGSDAFTGNTLVLDKTRHLEVDRVGNFEYLSFTLPGNFSVGSTGDAMITVTGGANLTGGNNRSSVIKAIDVEAGRSLLKGDEIMLISAGALTTNSGLTWKVTGRQDNTDYDFEIIRRDNELIARVVDIRVGPTQPTPSPTPDDDKPIVGGCDTGASVILPLFAAATLLYRRKKM
ncbi:MAG: hypothetical protein LBE65_03425, partial [Synergistaceae bacterium]|nr:hypothetical protein [Synergistaceae bacterium]